MNKLLFLAALWLCLSVAHAQIVRVEVGVGHNTYQPVPDGTWYQLGEPHKLKLSAPSFYIGLTGPVYESDHFGVNWHAGYEDLGQLSAACYCLIEDSDYDTVQHRRIRDPKYPNAFYYGRGKVRGILLMVEPYVSVKGYRIGAEFGLLPYRPQYDELVTGWQGAGLTRPASASMHVSHALQHASMVGLSISKGHWSLAYEFYRLPMVSNRTAMPPLWLSSHQLMVRYAW